MAQALVSWTEGMSFSARTGSKHEVRMDAHPNVGGENKAARPTELLLASLGGCTGMDVASILRKMRIPFSRFEVAVEADTSDGQPHVFTEFQVVYRLWGESISEEKYRRAVELSQEHYCSVSAMFRKIAPVHYRLELNDQPLG